MNSDTNERSRVTNEVRHLLRAQLNSQAYKSILDIWPGDPRYLALGKQFSPLCLPLGYDRTLEQSFEWRPGAESNGFFLVLGASGSGKTETLKALGSGIVNRGFPVLVLDFHGDVTFPGLNPVLLSSGPSSIVGVNPMDVDCFLDEQVGLYEQRVRLVEMIQRAVPTLGPRQKMLLQDAITLAYQRAGFRDDHPATWRNHPPTFVTVMKILNAWMEDEGMKHSRQSIPGCIAAIRNEFDHPVFSRQQHLTMDALLRWNVRVDLTRLSESVRYIVAETLLRKVFRALQLMGPIPVEPQTDAERFRLFVIVDEAKILTNGRGDIESSTHILNVIATEGRKFGLGLILASQMSSHFGSEVKANAASWLVMKPMAMDEAKKNAANIGVPPQALLDLRGKGDGYYRTRANPRARQIQVNRLRSNFDGRYEKLD